MTRLTARIERLERQRVERGGCLACTLAKMTDDTTACDGASCGLGLADLLMDMEEAKCEMC